MNRSESIYEPRCLHRSRKCSGVSRFDVLLVIGIIGVLAQIAVPAINSARESSRRNHCSNSLRQIGVAVQNYHLAKKGFPPNRMDCYHGSWATELWPYLEEGSRTDVWDPQKAFWYQSEQAREAQMPMLYCPARRQPPYLSQRGQEDRKKAPSGTVGALSDYVACIGDGSVANDYFEDNANGIFVTSKIEKPEGKPPHCSGEGLNLSYNGETPYVSMKDVTDGISKTFLVGEKYLPEGTYGLYSRNRYTYGDSSIHNPCQHASIGRYAGPKTPLKSDSWAPSKKYVPFGGSHAGVVQFVFADGSIHSVDLEIDGEILGYLASRNDGKSFDAPP
jgi:type II secretory pathway pseudopilin PulG